MSATLGLKLTPAISEQARTVLGGRRLTALRLRDLLDELTERRKTPMANLDESDRENHREPWRGPGIDPAIAEENLRAAMDKARAHGVDPNALRGEDDEGLPEAPSPIGNPLAVDRPLAKTITDDAEEISRLKAEGLSRFRETIDRTERKALHEVSSLKGRPRSLATLEDAASILIAELEPGAQDALRQFCLEAHVEPWVVAVASMQRVADLQEFTGLDFTDRQLNRGDTVGKSVVAPGECQRCGVTIPPNPEKRGQLFCCSFHGSERDDHSPGCPGEHVVMVRGRWVDTSQVRV